MTLREKQSLFCLLVGELLQHAYDENYSLTFGETYRSPEEAERLARAGKGIRNSLHTVRLAIDLNLFKDGKFLASTEDHRPLGEWWEQQHPLCRWGGRFGDGNHYSLEHEGRK
jgi:hypothetical protein